MNSLMSSTLDLLNLHEETIILVEPLTREVYHTNPQGKRTRYCGTHQKKKSDLQQEFPLYERYKREYRCAEEGGTAASMLVDKLPHTKAKKWSYI